MIMCKLSLSLILSLISPFISQCFHHQTSSSVLPTRLRNTNEYEYLYSYSKQYSYYPSVVSFTLPPLIPASSTRTHTHTRMHTFLKAKDDKDDYENNMTTGLSTNSNSQDDQKSVITQPQLSQPPPPPQRCIEVEEKFSISELGITALESKLDKMGFETCGNSVQFMDWYFDLPEPNWILTTSDNWFRYRELLIDEHEHEHQHEDKDQKKERQEQGSWQIKCGKVIPNENDLTGAATVYEELEGDEAINFVISILKGETETEIESECSSLNKPTTIHKKGRMIETKMDGFHIPRLPFPTNNSNNNNNNWDLVPFARIKTKRSSWIKKGNGENDNDIENTDIRVDIDYTDFGYTVAEVEIIVTREEDVKYSKEIIKEIIARINGNDEGKSTSQYDNDNDTPTLGKLELYMIQNRKNHFDACVKSGSARRTIAGFCVKNELIVAIDGDNN